MNNNKNKKGLEYKEIMKKEKERRKKKNKE